MLVLAIDTATPAVTAGVVELGGAVGQSDGGDVTVSVLAERVTLNARAHGELLTPHVLDATAAAGLTPRDLDAVVCGVGPGPYTGLRAGIVTAAAFADGLGRPAYPVCSLDAIAAVAHDSATDSGSADPPDPAPTGPAPPDPAPTGLALPDGAPTGAVPAEPEAAGESRDLRGASFLVLTDARRREVYWAAYDRLGRRTDGPHVDAPADVPASVSRRVEHAHPSPHGLVRAALGPLTSGADPDPLTPLYLRRPDAARPGPRKRVTAS